MNRVSNEKFIYGDDVTYILTRLISHNLSLQVRVTVPRSWVIDTMTRKHVARLVGYARADLRNAITARTYNNGKTC